MYCFTESLLSRRVLRPNFFTSIYVLFSNKIMFLLSKVVRTNLFIQYCLTFSRNSHKCIYRMSTQLNFLTCEQALPLAVSPLARAFSRDLFHSPKQESLLVGYQNFNWQLTNRLKFNRQLKFVLGFTVNWQRTWLSLISTKSVFKAFLIVLLHSFRQTQCTLKWIILAEGRLNVKFRNDLS